MAGIITNHQSSLARGEAGRVTGLFAAAAAKAGREIIWVVIAVAFCVVEALVFLADLPVGKIFHHRNTSKVSGSGR